MISACIRELAAGASQSGKVMNSPFELQVRTDVVSNSVMLAVSALRMNEVSVHCTNMGGTAGV